MTRKPGTRLPSLGPQIDYNFEYCVALRNTGKEDKLILEGGKLVMVGLTFK